VRGFSLVDDAKIRGGWEKTIPRMEKKLVYP
jgi:hypothetical protein